ncbi:MAG: hypothetical protein AB4042_05980 [Leptolyngbyaceae cyanobacterium]
MGKQSKIGQTLFWFLLGLTVLVWILRGMGWLTGMSGGFIWMLILATMSVGTVNTLLQTRRW